MNGQTPLQALKKGLLTQPQAKEDAMQKTAAGPTLRQGRVSCNCHHRGNPDSFRIIAEADGCPL